MYLFPGDCRGKTIFLFRTAKNANLCLLARKQRGRFKFFFTSKEVYPIVRKLEKITVKNPQAKVLKCAKNKRWVHRSPPGHLSVKKVTIL